MTNLDVFNYLSLNLQKYWYRFPLIIFRLRHVDPFSDLGFPDSLFPNFTRSNNFLPFSFRSSHTPSSAAAKTSLFLRFIDHIQAHHTR
jgi:hypothetical protein